jgi:hypothetical protein
MGLNLPVLEQLSGCQNLLIAGMGGGFDLFCGLPIYFELERRGQQAHLASYSFALVSRLKSGVRLTDTLVGVSADHQSRLPYFPEGHLARWFQEARREAVTIWCFAKTGPRVLLPDYRALVQHLGIDGILLIDGGVDSLLRGDEAQVGTLIEDATSLSAVSWLEEVPVRLIGCLGFGAERDMTYALVLENIAALAQAGAFLGSCSLARQMEAYQAYEAAVSYVHDQPVQEPSVINASVISAVQGQYGDYHLTAKTQGSRLWISPLMPIYWFFDLPAVAEHCLILSEIAETDSFMEAAFAFLGVRSRMSVRPAKRIPLP